MSYGADQGRICFSRVGNPMGSGIPLPVMLNGEKVGDSRPCGFFDFDRAPANYEINLASEVTRSSPSSRRTCARTAPCRVSSMGVLDYRAYLELVDKKSAEEDLKGLSFTGQPAAQWRPEG